MTEKKLPDFAMSEAIDQAHTKVAKKVELKCANCGREIKDNFIFVFPPAHFYCCIACLETDFEEADE